MVVQNPLGSLISLGLWALVHLTSLWGLGRASVLEGPCECQQWEWSDRNNKKVPYYSPAGWPQSWESALVASSCRKLLLLSRHRTVVTTGLLQGWAKLFHKGPGCKQLNILDFEGHIWPPLLILLSFFFFSNPLKIQKRFLA